MHREQLTEEKEDSIIIEDQSHPFTWHLERRTYEFMPTPEVIEQAIVKMKCPGCGWDVSSDTPKCPWEAGGDCPRHDAIDAASDRVREIQNSRLVGVEGDGI